LKFFLGCSCGSNFILANNGKEFQGSWALGQQPVCEFMAAAHVGQALFAALEQEG
jgi:hypothetical protein